MLIASLIDLYSLIVIAAVVLSWVQVDPRNPLVGLVRALTEPTLTPIRKVLPAAGGLDFSPMILLIGLQALKAML